MATSVQAPPAAPAAGGKPRGPGQKAGGKTVLRYVLLVILALIFISPLIFMLVTSFKTRGEATAVPPTWIPENPTTRPPRAQPAGSSRRTPPFRRPAQRPGT